MRVLENIVTAFLLLLFFLLTDPSTAEIKSIKIRSDDRPMILFQKFGFTHTGNITVGISSVSVTSTLSRPDPSRLGFFLLSEDLLIEVLLELQQNPNFCVVDSKFIKLLFTFRDLSPPPHVSFHKSYPVTYPNEYSLFFANCNLESHVTMDVITSLFNYDDVATATKNYLPVGLTNLPSIYLIFSVAYLAFLGFWISSILNNQPSVHRLHILMAVLLVTKAVSLFCTAAEEHYVKVTGTPHGWNVLSHVFRFTSVVISFGVIVLIGSGWGFVKPALVGKEKKVLVMVITLQVVGNVASIVIRETGPFVKDWVTWNQAFLLADVVCCGAVMFPIVWSIKSFDKTDVKILSRVRVFCMVVVGYLVVTRIGVFALKMNVGYKEMWVSVAAEEIGGLVFYLVVFYMFRPVWESDYFVLDDEGGYEEAPEMVKG